MSSISEFVPVFQRLRPEYAQLVKESSDLASGIIPLTSSRISHTTPSEEFLINTAKQAGELLLKADNEENRAQVEKQVEYMVAVALYQAQKVNLKVIETQNALMFGFALSQPSRFNPK